MICKLALEDGLVFTGSAVGATGTRTGEVVFNTAMTGYQEVFTDPSYCGQIVTMTFPLQGNYGVNLEDFESVQPHLSGVVIRELPLRPSNFRATSSLAQFLEKHGIIGLSGVDTRALTRRIRLFGALRGVLSTEIDADLELVERARSAAPMAGSNLVQKVVQPGPVHYSAASASSSKIETQSSECHIVAVDCGIKRNILRLLTENGCRVTTVPAATPAPEILNYAPDGVLVGNGPGDPAAVTDTVDMLKALVGRFPIFGICLGHQLLALALGAKTYKLTFGHHGVNLPVRNQQSGRVEITSQNHGFAVDRESIENIGGTATHLNLNDGSLEGFVHGDAGVFAVQFHPEASPGPHDASYLFQRFAQAAAGDQKVDVDLFH